METYTINLQQYNVNGAKVFIGRDRGQQVREASKIDSLADVYKHISVVVPENIYSINPSFLEEFLVNVVLKYGKEGFNNKFDFIPMGTYKVSKDLTEAVDRILRTENALV